LPGPLQRRGPYYRHIGLGIRRLVGLFAAAGFAVSTALGSHVQLLSSLPDEASSEAVQLDASGNIYAAGYLMPKTPKSSSDASDAFVAKLSPDGSQVLYLTIFGGSSLDEAHALALGGDGSVFVVGYTASSDFPVTAGALRPASGYFGGFIAKLNPSGSLVYTGTLGSKATGIVLDSAGDVFISGDIGGSTSGLPSTSGTVTGGPGGFILKLDSTLSQIQLSVNGYGGLIALDPQGDIHVAGTAPGNPYPGGGPPQLPAGAFQSSHAATFCYYASGDPSGPLAYDCNYQYVAEIDPSGTNLLWVTYVTGTYGATPTAIALDSENNVIVAGTTNSTDYPVTAGALQAEYPPNGASLANVPVGTTTVGGFVYFFATAPGATGYITKLNPTGSALVWSTYFGGSYADNIGGMAIDANGDIYVSGLAGSSDLPRLSNAPNGCQPSPSQAFEFLARIAADGSQTVASKLVCGAPVSCLNAPNSSACGGAYGEACLYPGVVFPGRFFNSVPVAQSLDNYCGGVLTGPYSSWPAALRPDGRAVVAGANGTVTAVDFLKFPPVDLRHGPIR
jgi:Beta-propeller repeat